MAQGHRSHPWKTAGGIRVLRTGLPQHTSSLPKGVWRFYLRGNCISWQCFGHWNATKNAQDKAYLLPQTFYVLSTLTFSFLPFHS